MKMQFTGERFVPDEGGQIRYEHVHRYALSTELVRGKVVLDIASGEGYGSAVLAKVAQSVVGVDVDAECIAFAQKKYHNLANLEFRIGSCDKIPLLDQSIDVVTSFETIEHHDKHEEMMQEIKRVLKPEGLLIISSPDKLTYSDIPNYCNPFHIKELYRGELCDLLGNYFNHVNLYGQRLATGSFIYALNQSKQNTFKAYTLNSFENTSQQVCSLDSAIYLIAVCSNSPINSLNHAIDSVYIDRIDDLYNSLNSNLSFYFHLTQKAKSEVQKLEHQLQQSQYASTGMQSHAGGGDTKNYRNSKSLAEHSVTQTFRSSLQLNSAKVLDFPSISPLKPAHDQPFWSIMIPTYNPDPVHFKQTLESVLSQAGDLGAMQIEVVDDHSTQLDVEALVQEIGQGRVSYYQQPKNLGLIENWNNCLQRAKGAWVHLLHQDDVVLPDFYARLHSALRQQSDVGAAFCRHFHIDSEDNQQYVSPIERPTPGILENWLERIATVQRIQFASIVVKRSTYEALGGFYPKAGSAADWEMWKRIAVHHPVWYEPEPLACYRLHAFSESSRLQKTGQDIADTRRAIQISASYLPPEQSTQLTSEAMEHYALSALSMAEQMLSNNDSDAAFAQIQEGLKCSQSDAVTSRLIAMLLQEKPETKPEAALQPRFIKCLKQYKENPLNETAKAYLSQVREQCVYSIRDLSDEQLANNQLNWIETYKALVTSGIQDKLPSGLNQDFGEKILEQHGLKQDYKSTVRNLLIEILYCRPEQLSWDFDLEAVPHWFINDYLRFIMTPPIIFQKVGEADRYYQFLRCWVNYLYDHITTNPDSVLWREAAIQFTSNANFIPLYFNYENLRDVYAKRAQIMATALAYQGHELDYEFPERSADRQKIRLGILAAHFSPQSETFASLTSYKHLNRDEFEIILFSIAETHHRLEHYCIGHADAFVVLPGGLQAQVQTIREADLDILYVVTNVTAVSNAIALLTLHRLARIQVINVCSCTSTGMKHADYYISGNLTEPEQEQQHTERLLLIDGPAHCYDLATEEFARPTVSISRSHLGIGENEVVYISGANFFKILPEVEVAWAQILASVPNSKLILYPFNPNWAASYPKVAFEQRLQRTLQEYGIASDRVIILEPAPSYGDVKERLKLANVYLDAFPFAGATSLIDPLTLGLPTVVMNGNAFRSRMSAAFLRELHMPELIAINVEEYISLAIMLGIHPKLRHQRQEKILQQMQRHPKFVNSRHYSAEHGVIFQKIFAEYQITQLQHSYRLRSINLLALPDWNQPEADVLQTLVNLFREILTHPDRSQITVLLGIGSMDQNIVDEWVSSVIMHLLTEEEIEMGEEEPEISLIGSLSSVNWQQLLPCLAAQIPLEQEDPVTTAVLAKAIELSSSKALPIFESIHASSLNLE